MIPRSRSTDDLRLYWQWRIQFCLMGCYLFYYTGRLVINHALPLMGDDLGFNEDQLGRIVAALLFAYGIGQAVNGNLGDRLGARRMVAIGAVGSAIICWIFSFQSTMFALIVVWAANGYVQSFGWAPGGRLISLWWPSNHRGRAFGLYVFAAGCATILVNATSWLVLALVGSDDPANWRWLFRIPVLALAIAGVVFYLLVRDRPADVGLAPIDDDPPPNPETGDSNESTENQIPATNRPQEGWTGRYRFVVTNPLFLAAAAVIFFQSFARYGLLTWIPSYYENSGIEIKRSIAISMSLAVGMSFGAFAGGYLSDRLFLGRRALGVALFLAASAVCCVALILIPVHENSNPIVGAAILFLSGFFVYGAQGPLWALCPDIVGPQHSGTAVGIMDAVAYLAAGVQALVLGRMIHSVGYPTAFFSIFLLVVTGGFVALFVRK